MKHRWPVAKSYISTVLSVGLLSGCMPPREIGDELLFDETVVDQGTVLGGEAIAQMKHQMQRAERDMIHFYEEVESMQHRSDQEGFRLLADFFYGYMTLHLDPLLRVEWQSRHPELMATDANLRLLKAQVLLLMRDSTRLKKVIDEIELRYRGRGSMIVEYPIGSQSTLEEALHVLGTWKWRS